MILNCKYIINLYIYFNYVIITQRIKNTIKYVNHYILNFIVFFTIFKNPKKIYIKYKLRKIISVINTHKTNKKISCLFQIINLCFLYVTPFSLKARTLNYLVNSSYLFIKSFACINK